MAKKNQHAVALGKRGARLGGLATAAARTKQQRSDAARHAALIRWTGHSRPTRAELLDEFAEALQPLPKWPHQVRRTRP